MARALGREREATQAPTIAEWWPLLWATDIDQHARPMSCLALAAFEWPEALDTRFEPIEGWFEWERN
eukprot:948064-Pyramimonas_sp.AAC.1